jgi:hypothetical protein
MSKDKNRNIIHLLNIIYNELTLDNLLEFGLEYSQIAVLLETIIKKDYVVLSDSGDMSLTDSGLKILDSLKKYTYPEDLKGWVLPEDKYRIDKLGMYDIYLPSRKSIQKLVSEP